MSENPAGARRPASRSGTVDDDGPGGVERMLTGLLQDSHQVALEGVPSLVGEHAAKAGLHEVLIYLTDLQQTTLRLLAAHGAGAGEGAGGDPGASESLDDLRIDGTLAGRAFQEVRILSKHDADGAVEWWWVPLLDGTERLGVLRIRAKDADEHAVDAMRHLASVVALMVVSKRALSDTYARLVRTRSMHVAAEMQWTLMPPLTFVDDQVAIAAIMEPAYEVGGDAFDYAIAGDTVHLGLFDAMGHDVSAGLTACLAVAACRNNRRQGADLIATSEAIERVLIDEFGRGTRFVTAVLANLDTVTGTLTWVNRGHHPPVVIRGGRWVTTLECRPSHPMGLDLHVPITLCREQLEPGDRVMFYSDGVIEARNAEGEEFGLERFVDFVIRRTADGLPVPETLRRLVRGVLDYHDGNFQDDATVLLAEWHGSADRDMKM
ncbi:PP2C family protein-serine/threonine phosphatase [Sphaerisporangium sp. TRM90804]|uniref:PP2C family protein-serine/threonine phosphatase n=1 Tax=Sphaerisporangium sp. TRM90804 TaxID=3031113 RepID=UPI00244B55DA|nr:PP2C family protein-serine/threonine phosphatase [Sphaerisporangium sp. TRM90804]MDH2429380.1 PP2C family protein-serine/threonine phosphatase [Sphaerisporangium sp. TRM90804]